MWQAVWRSIGYFLIELNIVNDSREWTRLSRNPSTVGVVSSVTRDSTIQISTLILTGGEGRLYKLATIHHHIHHITYQFNSSCLSSSLYRTISIMYTALYLAVFTAVFHYTIVLAISYHRTRKTLSQLVKAHNCSSPKTERPWDILGLIKVYSSTKHLLKETALGNVSALFNRYGDTYASRILTQRVYFT